MNLVRRFAWRYNGLYARDRRPCENARRRFDAPGTADQAPALGGPHGDGLLALARDRVRNPDD